MNPTLAEILEIDRIVLTKDSKGKVHATAECAKVTGTSDDLIGAFLSLIKEWEATEPQEPATLDNLGLSISTFV